jgi:hypothetical protein
MATHEKAEELYYVLYVILYSSGKGMGTEENGIQGES